MGARKVKKIVLTGGHAATTALSVIEELVRRSRNEDNLSWDLYWLGTKMAFEGKKIPTLEFEIFPDRGVTFQHIISGRIQRKFTHWTVPSLLKIPVGFIHAFLHLVRIRPKVILSFGGFTAFPVVVSAWLLRIPILLHEQTSAVGRANKVSSIFANKIFISRKTSKQFLPKRKTVLTGNPIMTQIEEIEPLEGLPKKPIIFITGGSRGSEYINNMIFSLLDDLLSKYYVIHQTGYHSHAKAVKVKKGLKKSFSNNYEIYSTIDPMQMDGVYKRASIIIARAGANTVSEIIAIKRPAILIPIQWAAYNEQFENAIFASKLGVARILNQDETTSTHLFNEIEDIFMHYTKITKSMSNKKSIDMGASKRVVDEVEKWV